MTTFFEVIRQAKKYGYGLSDESSRTKLLRDKVYTLLYNKVSEIREYGRYVFWKDVDRKEKYKRLNYPTP